MRGQTWTADQQSAQAHPGNHNTSWARHNSARRRPVSVSCAGHVPGPLTACWARKPQPCSILQPGHGQHSTSKAIPSLLAQATAQQRSKSQGQERARQQQATHSLLGWHATAQQRTAQDQGSAGDQQVSHSLLRSQQHCRMHGKARAIKECSSHTQACQVCVSQHSGNQSKARAVTGSDGPQPRVCSSQRTGWHAAARHTGWPAGPQPHSGAHPVVAAAAVHTTVVEVAVAATHAHCAPRASVSQAALPEPSSARAQLRNSA